MRELVVVQELDGVAKLVRDMSHVIHGIGLVIVVLEKVENAQSEHFERDASVSMVVEPVQNLHAQATIERRSYAIVLTLVDGSTHCSMARLSANFSNALISSLAASRYFSTFLMIFSAIVWSITLSLTFTTRPNVPSPRFARILYRF